MSPNGLLRTINSYIAAITLSITYHYNARFLPEQNIFSCIKQYRWPFDGIRLIKGDRKQCIDKLQQIDNYCQRVSPEIIQVLICLRVITLILCSFPAFGVCIRTNTHASRLHLRMSIIFEQNFRKHNLLRFMLKLFQIKPCSAGASTLPNMNVRYVTFWLFTFFTEETL